MAIVIPEELVQQFRSVASERLDRVETSWAAVLGSLDESAATLLHRELHTLKGESKMLGFADVNLVCHKLEDMLEVAKGRGYAVDEDFDFAVNMAIRFMGMLVRKKVGAHLSGIDLPGFIRQIDNILAELKPETKPRSQSGSTPPKTVAAAARVTPALRARLAPMAVDAFIEYATARGLRRDRLRLSWHGLRDIVGIHRAVIGPGQLSKHKSGGEALARELGKRVDIIFDIGTAEANAEILSAIDTAILHLVRNAIDHGIEAAGTLRVTVAMQGESLVATVSDDGRGISFEQVRARAIDVGLLAPTEMEVESRWLDLVCSPGFTTRAHASDVSGRGVGLDAVRSSILEVGGTLTATTGTGKGTTWRIAIPVPKLTFESHALRAPGVPFPVVIDDTWRLTDAAPAATAVVDVAFRLGLTTERVEAPVRFFTNGDRTVGLVTDRAPQAVSVRRLVMAPPPALGDVVVLDTIEGLLLHLDRV